MEIQPLVLIKYRAQKASCGKEWKHEYKCFCGNTFLTFKNFVERGHTRSCGCLKYTGIHGHTKKSKSRTYTTWDNMIQRCKNPKRNFYEYYGGRGIKVCTRWLKFENFLKDMGERPEGTSIDRIDPNGNYELNNCRWATKLQQANNTRKTNRAKIK